MTPDLPPTPLRGLLDGPPQVVTVGAELLAAALRAQGALPTTVDWRPAMPGTASDLATVLADPRRAPANARGLDRVLTAGAPPGALGPAAAAPRGRRGDPLHAGPPFSLRPPVRPVLGRPRGGP